LKSKFILGPIALTSSFDLLLLDDQNGVKSNKKKKTNDAKTNDMNTSKPNPKKKKPSTPKTVNFTLTDSQQNLENLVREHSSQDLQKLPNVSVEALLKKVSILFIEKSESKIKIKNNKIIEKKN